MKNAFNDMDLDHDGSLSKDEISKAGGLLGSTFDNDGRWESIIK